MEKKKAFLLFCLILVFVMIFTASVSAQDEEKETIDPKELIKTADDTIFVKSAFLQEFSEAQGIINELIDEEYVHQYYVNKGKGIDILNSFFPAEKDVRTGNKWLTFDQARKSDFHVSYDVSMEEEIPSSGGSCWLRYSNVSIKGKGRESGVILHLGGKAYAFTPGEADMDYSEIGEVPFSQKNNRIKIDIIRLNGLSYFYADGEFLFQYEDNISEAVSFESGAELYEGGNRILCQFDNFSMRIQ